MRNLDTVPYLSIGVQIHLGVSDELIPNCIWPLPPPFCTFRTHFHLKPLERIEHYIWLYQAVAAVVLCLWETKVWLIDLYVTSKALVWARVTVSPNHVVTNCSNRGCITVVILGTSLKMLCCICPVAWRILGYKKANVVIREILKQGYKNHLKPPTLPLPQLHQWFWLFVEPLVSPCSWETGSASTTNIEKSLVCQKKLLGDTQL